MRHSKPIKNTSIRKYSPRYRASQDDYPFGLVRVSNADILIAKDKDLLEMKSSGSCRIVTLGKINYGDDDSAF